MIELARTTDLSKTAIADYPIGIVELKEDLPLVGWPAMPNELALADRPYVLVQPVPPPAVAEFGEKAVKGAPELVDGKWRQTWTVQTIALAEAKQMLAEMAIGTYWSKMQDTPSLAELTAAAGSYAQIINSRETRFKPRLLQTRSDILNATTVQECYDIWLTLRDLA